MVKHFKPSEPQWTNCTERTAKFKSPAPLQLWGVVRRNGFGSWENYAFNQVRLGNGPLYHSYLNPKANEKVEIEGKNIIFKKILKMPLTIKYKKLTNHITFLILSVTLLPFSHLFNNGTKLNHFLSKWIWNMIKNYYCQMHFWNE